MFERSIPKEARQAFCLHPPYSAVTAWCMFKDGRRWGTPDTTKRLLLIGYDLLPLNGLATCERLLAEKGIYARRCKIETCRESTLLAVTHRGDLNVESCSWSVCCDYAKNLRQIAGASFSSACGWVGTQIEKSHPEDYRVISRWWWTAGKSKSDRWTLKDGRRANTARRLITDCVDIFRKHDFQISPVNITELR